MSGCLTGSRCADAAGAQPEPRAAKQKIKQIIRIHIELTTENTFEQIRFEKIKRSPEPLCPFFDFDELDELAECAERVDAAAEVPMRRGYEGALDNLCRVCSAHRVSLRR